MILRKIHSFQTLDEDEFVAFYYNLLERPEIGKLVWDPMIATKTPVTLLLSLESPA